MNQKSLIGILAIFLAFSILLNVYSLLKVRDIETHLMMSAKKLQELDVHQEIELAEKMMYLHRFSEKLYFAGKKQNWELAEFYLEELEETAERIVQAKKIEDGINISAQMSEMLIPKIKDLEEIVKKQNAKGFEGAYKSMIMNCNGCHMATRHGFVKVREPQQNYYHQEF